LEEQISFVTSDSLVYLASSSERYDLIFLDGDHAPSAVYSEIPAALSMLRSGGVILLHDYFPALEPLWPDGKVIQGPWLAVERLRSEGAKIKAIPLGELPWPTKLGSRKTSLALLVREGAS
jgi:predicted O-methyltransferase YrrM